MPGGDKPGTASAFEAGPSSSGIVIANTSNGGDNYCVLVLQEHRIDIGAGCSQLQRRVVRPIPAARNESAEGPSVLCPNDPTNPFWNGCQYGRLSVGESVSFGGRGGIAPRSSSSRNGSSPLPFGTANHSQAHANEDLMCEVLERNGEGRLSMAEIYDKLEPLAEGDVAAHWPMSAFFEDQGHRSIRANVNVPSVNVVRGTITHVVRGEHGVRANIRCGGTCLKNLPVKCEVGASQVQDDSKNCTHIPGLLVLGLARNKYSAAHAKCPVMLCEFYPEPEQVAGTVDATPLNKISLQNLSVMMGLLDSSQEEVVSTETMFNFFLTECSPFAAAAMGADPEAMKKFADSYNKFFVESVKFYRPHCCVVQFPMASDRDVTSFSVIVADTDASPRRIFAAKLNRSKKAKANGAMDTTATSNFQEFLNAIVTALGQCAVQNVQGPKSETSSECLTQATNEFVFEIWKDTIYAATASPVSLSALRICYHSELLQQQMRRVSIKKYSKHDIELMFRINQGVAHSFHKYQRKFGYGYWNTNQKKNNETLNRQLKQWEMQVQQSANRLKQMELERREQIAGQYTIPVHGALEVKNQIMQLGLQNRQTGNRNNDKNESNFAVNIEHVIQRCAQLTDDVAIFHTHDTQLDPCLFSEKCRAFVEAFQENPPPRENEDVIRNFQIVMDFQNMVMETSFRNPDFFAHHRRLKYLDEKTIRVVFELYHLSSLAHRNLATGRFSKHPEQQLSVETLVGLSCYLFVYNKMSRSEYPDLFASEYGPGVAEHLCKLQHLILKSKFYENIALYIYNFLHREHKDRRPLFNLNQMQVTKDFCAKYSQLQLAEQLKIENINDAARLMRRQEERKRRDHEIKRLHSEIQGLKSQLAIKESELAMLYATLPIQILYRNVRRLISRNKWRDCEESYTNPAYTAHMSKIHSCEYAISCLNNEIDDRTRQIAALKKKIDPVMSPLPEELPQREEVLGMLYLPENLRILADFGASAEAAFLSDWDRAGSNMNSHASGFQVQDYGNTWVAHYNNHQIYKFTSPDLGEQKISNGFCNFSKQTAKESSFFSAFYQSVPSKSDTRIGDRWFPNGFEREFGWRWQGHLVNPFKYSEQVFLDLYQETLRGGKSFILNKDRSLLQQFMQLTFDDAKTAKERENLPLSEQHQCPEEWTEQQFQTFGSLRAFATPQTARNLVKVLRTQSLPLPDSRVQQAIRMILYLTGPINMVSDSNVPSTLLSRLSLVKTLVGDSKSHRTLWAEFEENPKFFDSLTADIADLVDTFKEKRRDHHAFALLVDLVAYFLPMAPGILTRPLNELAATCVKIAKEHKARCDECLTECGDETKRLMISVSQHLLYALSAYLKLLRCGGVHGGHVAKLVNPNPVELVLKILSTNTMLREVKVEAPIFSDENARYIHEELQQCCALEMAENLGAIHSIADDTVLSRVAEQCVGESRQLSALTWTRISVAGSSGPRAVVHAQGPRGNIYSLNLLTGDFLINGYYRDRLPDSIRSDPTYKRTFADLDFKISRSSDGVCTTTRVFNDSRFEFREESCTSTGAPRVVCSEVKQVGEDYVRFDVLPLAQVCKFLPVSLVERFTHWYCAKYSLLLIKTLLDADNFKKSGLLFEETKFVVLNLSKQQSPIKCQQVPRQIAKGFLEREEVMECFVDGRVDDVLSADLPFDRKQLVCIDPAENHVLTNIISVLGKFESCNYIDIYASPCEGNGGTSSVKEIEFVRYGLRFYFDASYGVIHSCDHTDYHLAPEQVLPGQLAPFQFTNFLLLQRTDPAKVHLDKFIVLLPDGCVDVDCTGAESKPIDPTAHVDPSLTASTLSWGSSPTAKDLANDAAGPSALLQRKLDWQTRKHFAYTIKQEGAPLKAGNFAGWLQLASLYVTSDSPVPESSCSRFPYEVAMDIVRKAVANRPLTSDNLYKLSNLLHVVNSELQHCSSQGHRALGARLGNVKLLAQLLYEFSESVNFCYADNTTGRGGDCEWRVELIATIEAQIDYLRGQTVAWYETCSQLTTDEEREQFGCSQIKDLQDKTQRRLDFETAGLSRYPTQSDHVSKVEMKLQAALLKPKPNNADGHSEMPNLPRLLKANEHSKVGKKILDELQESWKALCDEKHFELEWSKSTVFAQTLLQEQALCQQEQSRCFTYIVEALCVNPYKLAGKANITEAERRDGFMLRAFEKLHLTNDNRFAQIESSEKEQNHAAFLGDLNLIFLEKDLIGKLNPFLTKPCIDEVHRVVQLYLELEVLKEKFLRMVSSHCGITEGEIQCRQTLEMNLLKNQGLLVQELSCIRKWSPVMYPGWLAFEVENRLQIRPQQYDIADLCIQHPNSIAQLNMGEGKTRVIIPMLVIEFTRRGSLAMSSARHPPIMRITILRALIGEFVEYLTQTLQHSVFRKRIYVTPFNRDVEIHCPKNAKKLRDTFMECAMNGGIIVETPESRMSKMLKLQELQMKASDYRRVNEGQRNKPLEEAVGFLQEIVMFPAVDVLDEADEELNNKYQLIYAVRGRDESTIALPHGEVRWHVLEAVYRVLNSASATVEDFLDVHQVAICRGENAGRGRFRPIRFLADQKEWKLPGTKHEMSSIILNELLHNPPYELKCLKALQTSQQAGYARKFVLEPESTHVMDGEFMQLIDKEQIRSILLCLRGYLSTGVVWNALEKRHRVEYGLNLKAGKKQLAVPYRASDTPAERAEYGHPDMALALTLLSWYYDGLTESALRKCFAALLRKGKVARQELYKAWFRLATESVDCDEMEELGKINSIDKVDLQNEEQFQLLLKTFQYNFETINVYLNLCIFPTETRQYPHKIVANAFHLAESRGHTVGFSGTKDNSLLLPPEVQQKTLPHLLGTDAKMIACVAKTANETYHTGPRTQNWRDTMDAILECGNFDALVEAGGLLAGSSNAAVAERVLTRIVNYGYGRSLKGVVYFSPLISNGLWMVVDSKGIHEPLAKSALHEADCFVFYDQSRTRGADMKLKHDAKAIVTLGPKMTKDSTMQAVGRLRKIAFGQTVEFYGPPEVTTSIHEDCNDLSDNSQNSNETWRFPTLVRLSKNTPATLTSRDILFWITQNTIRSVENGLLPWASQAGTYCAVAGDSELALLDEKCDLQSFYGHRTENLFICDAGKKDFEGQLRLARQQKEKLYEEATDLMNLQARQDDSTHPPTASNEELLQNSQCFYRTQTAVLRALEDFGGDRKVTRSTLDDEYERELEQEEEEEYERELPPREKAAKCSSWKFESLIEARDCSEYYQGKIDDVFRETEYHQHFQGCGALMDMFNTLCDVRVTDDFRVVLSKQSRKNSSNMHFRGMGRFLRPVNSFLVISDHTNGSHCRHMPATAVCVTDREAGQILHLIYSHGRQFHDKSPEFIKNSVILVTHVPNGAKVSCGNHNRNSRSPALMPVNVAGDQPPESVLDQKLSAKLITALQLFNGESIFPSADGYDLVRSLFEQNDGDQRAKLARGLRAIRNMRGRQNEFERSNLDEIQKGFGVDLLD